MRKSPMREAGEVFLFMLYAHVFMAERIIYKKQDSSNYSIERIGARTSLMRAPAGTRSSDEP
jgi:hypothetical protein